MSPAEPEQQKQEKRHKAQASQTLLRGLDIIDAVANDFSDLSEIAKVTGMTYSTAHRILSALQQRNYIRRDPEHGYRLGHALLGLGYQAQAQIDLVKLANPLLLELAKKTSDTVHLGMLIQDSIVYLEKISSRRPVEISSRIGGNKPLFSTGIGKALILDQSEEQWLALFDRSSQRLEATYSRNKWLKMMRHYAREGFAFDLGEDEPAIRCVAAPVRDGRNHIIAAVSVSSTVEYMPPWRMQELVSTVQHTALQISTKLGFRTA
ncbi:transcriptional regulator [Oligella sp. HMSC05A10]|nr:transcriptional regulator [Oligella sp. HMSC05A10]